MKGEVIDKAYSYKHLIPILDRADELFADYGGDNHSYVKNALIPALNEADQKLSIWENKDEPAPEKPEKSKKDKVEGTPDQATSLQETNPPTNK